MKVRMKKTKSGSENGVTVLSYKEGQTYDITPDLAKAFVDDLDVAERVEDELDEPDEPADLTDSSLEKEVDALLTDANTSPVEKTVETDPETPGDSPDTEKTVETVPEVPEGDSPDMETGEINDGTDETGKEQVDPDENLVAASGRPYTSYSYASSSMKQRGLEETHEPVEIPGGYALAKKKAHRTYPPPPFTDKE